MDKFPTLLEVQSACVAALYYINRRLTEEVENIILMYYTENPSNIVFKSYFDRYGTTATTATPAAPVKTPVKTPEKVEPSPFSPTLPQKLPEPKNG